MLELRFTIWAYIYIKKTLKNRRHHSCVYAILLAENVTPFRPVLNNKYTHSWYQIELVYKIMYTVLLVMVFARNCPFPIILTVSSWLTVVCSWRSDLRRKWRVLLCARCREERSPPHALTEVGSVEEVSNNSGSASDSHKENDATNLIVMIIS